MALNTNKNVAANGIVNLDEAKSFLKETGTDNDAEIVRMVNGLSAAFEQEVGRKIRTQTLTDFRVDGTGKSSLLFPYAPVQSIAEIELRNSDESVYRTITLAADFVIKDKGLGLIMLINDSFIKGQRNILFTTDVGFAMTDPEFARAQELLLTQLAFDYRAWQNNEIGLTSRTLPDGSVTFNSPHRFLQQVYEGLEDLRDRRFI